MRNDTVKNKDDETINGHIRDMQYSRIATVRTEWRVKVLQEDQSNFRLCRRQSYIQFKSSTLLVLCVC